MSLIQSSMNKFIKYNIIFDIIYDQKRNFLMATSVKIEIGREELVRKGRQYPQISAEIKEIPFR